MDRIKYLWPYPQEISINGDFDYPAKIRITGEPARKRFLKDAVDIGGFGLSDKREAYSVEFKIDKSIKNNQEYRLDISKTKTTVAALRAEGLLYGAQTLLQVFALCRGTKKMPSLSIRDWPAYRGRSFMIDMGRTVYPARMIKRIIRILSRLKMNQLHIHLYDDELCGIRFDGFPFGKENPYSLSIPDLRSLVKYAGRYNIEIIPELEAWGTWVRLSIINPRFAAAPGCIRAPLFLFAKKHFR